MKRKAPEKDNEKLFMQGNRNYVQANNIITLFSISTLLITSMY